MANVKILLVGSDQVWSLERIYLQYIREFGITSEIFACQDLFMEYYTASLWNKLKFRAGVSAVYKRINEQFEEQVKQFNPAIIWIFKGMEILPETIIRLKKKGYKFVSFNPDNPFLFSGRGSGNSNVTKSIPLYDLHFTYDRSIKLQLEKKYHLPAGLLPFGFDVNANVYESCSLQKEVNKVCFLGNPDKERTAFITRLAEADLAIDLYGNQWQQYVQHSNITVFPPIFGKEFWEVLRRYRVQLNLMRPHNPDSHNMRSFDVPGIGGIGLFPDTRDHQLYFKDREEVFLFKSPEQCTQLAKEILGLSTEEALRIRQQARGRSLMSGYSYKSRTRQAIEVMESLFL